MATVAVSPGSTGVRRGSPAGSARPGVRRLGARARTVGPPATSTASNGSAWSNQREPKTMAPSSMTATNTANQARMTGRVARSGATSSSQVKAANPAAAGQRPTRRQRSHPDSRIEPGRPAEQKVHGPQRVDQPPDRAEQQREWHDADPQQHVYDAGGRVGREVGPRDGAPGDVRGRDKSEQTQGPSCPGRVGCTADAQGERAPAPVAAEPRAPPGHAQDEERDDESCRGTGHRQGERDRQVLTAADPVSDHRCAGHRTSNWNSSRPPSRGSRPRTRRARQG